MATLQEARELLKSAISHNRDNAGGSNASYIIPMFWSLPGEGKTTMVEDVFEEMELPLTTVLAATYDPGEFAGYPMVDRESREYFRARPFFMPTGGIGGIFFDEAPQSPTALQNILAQIANERRCGDYFLPEGYTVVFAGNPMHSKAGTQPMPSQLKDRLLHVNIETDHAGFREYALAKGFEPVITGYTHERPEWLQKFDPSVNASPSPRSWERVDTVLKMNLPANIERIAIEGLIGEGALADFLGYKKIWTDLPSAASIFANPESHGIPEQSMILYALCSSLAHKANKSNISALITYINRFPNKEFTAFCMKDTIKRNPDLMNHPEVTSWFFEHGQLIML